MNKKLKAKIIEKYGTQADFAPVINTDESLISKFIRGRRKLSPENQRIWADALDCKPRDIFEEYRSSKEPAPETLLTEEEKNGNK